MNGASFGAAAAILSGKAALLLGWTLRDFWLATPEELRTALSAMTPDAGEVPLARDALDAMIAKDKG